MNEHLPDSPGGLSPAERRALLELLDAAILNEATDEQFAAFEQQLRTSDAARTLAVRYLHLHGLLERFEARTEPAEARGGEWATAFLPVAPSPSPLVGSSHRRLVPSPRRPLTRSSLAWSILAASLLFAAYFVGISWDMLSREPAESTQRDLSPLAPDKGRGAGGEGDAVATILDTSDVEWSAKESEIPNLKSQITSGQPLSIQSGLVELELTQGTKLLIEGPAEWSIDGNNNATLKRGKLVAKVPQQAIGFTLSTPTARIIDLGTEFGVEVGGGGAVEVHVLRGAVETIKLAADGTKPNGVKATRLEAGSAIRIAPGSAPEERIAADRERFAAAKVSPDDAFLGAIPLGRLFDDRPPTSLAKAIDTDTFAAVPDSGHLGVESVFFGGDPVRRISRGVSFDLANLGWGGSRDGSVANAAVVGHGEQGRGATINTGKSIPTNPTAKKEAGIGMHANGLVTFNLDEIRVAAGQPGQSYRFVSERAGVNSAAFGAVSSVYLLVMVSDDNKVLFATVNGMPAEIAESSGVWRVEKHPSKPMLADRQYVSFDVALPPQAKFLTLAATAAGDDIHADHAVWSGARLEPNE